MSPSYFCIEKEPVRIISIRLSKGISFSIQLAIDVSLNEYAL